ncbi:TPA: hypothetical protein DCF80_03795 [Candidatus Saccharibacteria bacterium]|nr:hypothetical protein [Candidatus Saccharibacteria bacterium]HRK41032.1 hypothetical protein [Candidatus Saccharibacteria bacterium]
MAKKKMPVDAQVAAVRSMMDGGTSLDTIAKDYADLAEGVAQVRSTSAAPPRRRGSGPTSEVSSLTRRPSL